MDQASFEPDLSAWDAWHPSEVARHLGAVDMPWYVTAGWALDLFHGRQTRDHEDIEIAVPAEGFPAVRFALSEFELYAIGAGLAHRLTPETLAATHQTWVREQTTALWRLDVVREPWDGNTWVFRRDSRVRLPRTRVIAHTDNGIPYAQPEVVLLYKAKDVREKDEADFAAVLPLLGSSRRNWLSEALTLVYPGHRWLEALRAGSTDTAAQ